MKVLARSGFHVGQAGDVQNQRSSVDVADVGAVGTLGEDLDVVRAIAVVELRMARRQTTGQAGVALSRAGIPPAAHLFRMPRIAQVHDHVELIVERCSSD